jgi:hypothetical protein
LRPSKTQPTSRILFTEVGGASTSYAGRSSPTHSQGYCPWWWKPSANAGAEAPAISRRMGGVFMTQLELLPGGKEPPHVPRVVCGSILQHPRWPEFSLWLKAEPRGTTKSWRVEFRSPPAGAAEWLLKIRVRCAACGAETSPVRTRKQPENKRHETVGHGLFLAVTCPVSVNAGCCRGKAVKEEFARILDALPPGARSQ